MNALPMGLVLAQHSSRTPGRTAIRCGAGAMTYAELDAAASRAARHLAEAGVGPGETVAIALPNGLDFVVTAFATWRLDAVPFPMSNQLPPPERDALLDLAQATLVVGDPLPGRVTISAAALRRDCSSTTPLPVPNGTHPWKIIGSGGSTGRPKLIVAGESAIVDPAAERYTIRTDDVVLVPGPLHHQGPFIFTTAALFTGGTAVLMERFDAEEALALIEQHQVTWVFFVPTMTHRIWRLPDDLKAAADLSSLRLLFSTGAPWPTWSKQNWIDWLGSDRIIEWYGGTEEQGGLRITGDEALAHPGSVGHADDDVRVITEDGTDAEPGEVGELVFRSRPGGRHSSIGALESSDEWRSYGDMASLDDERYVHLADRRTDLIVSGGVNIYPAEVEGALEAHPAVRSAIVVGLPDEDLGQRAHAVVELDPHALALSAIGAGTADELRAHLRGRLAAAKVPRQFEFVNRPLRDSAGKVRRSAIREARMAEEPEPA